MALNRQQQRAVETTEGPLLIVAGAGSGKTTVLVHRIVNILQKGTPPENVLAVTFTNKAAGEMRERIAQAVGPERGARIWMSTFHSMCVRILRAEAKHTGRLKQNFAIYDTSDSKSILKKIIQAHGLDPKEVKPAVVQNSISALKNEMIDAATLKSGIPSSPNIDWQKAVHILGKMHRDRLAEVELFYEPYQRALERNNAVDFDDLISLVAELFEKRPDVLEKYQNRFRYIMVDEYQDTNHAQYVLVKMLAAKHKNLAVVGDDSQSIYGWRGADIRNILEFEKEYPGLTKVNLEQNYRCRPAILQAANEIISKNVIKLEKKLFTEKAEGEKIGYYFAGDDRDEARFVTNEILRRMKKGLKHKDFAILYRTNSQSQPFEEAFMRAGVPYQLVGGLKFFDRKEIKDVVAYLQFIDNPQDTVAFSRIANVPRRGLSDAAAEALVDASRGEDFWSFLQNPDGVKLSPQAKKGLAAFVGLMEPYINARQSEKIGTTVSKLLLNSGYASMLEKAKKEKTDDLAEERLGNVSELVNLAIEMENDGQGTLREFLEHASLRGALDEASDGDAVRLMTLHSAKGLEFPVVFMTGMEEGVFPHKRSEDPSDLEEERRICYVGVTRAEEKLTFTHCMTRRVWGKQEQNEPSRFLSEFSRDLIDPSSPMMGFAKKRFG